MAYKRKSRSTKPPTNYKIKKAFGLADGKDLPNLVIAVAEAGFQVRDMASGNPREGTITLALDFPVEGEDPVRYSVTSRSDDDEIVYTLARLLIADNIISL